MKNVIAATLELDPSELDDYRYKPTRTTRAIYDLGDQYFCQGKYPPKDEVGGPWRKWSDQFWAERANTIVWVCDGLLD